ncbi:MAG: zinc ribbon-containing protein, partial [Gammaproteobacteria bacterium]|nr:zinc ribbon-containing protein [Gammaproteobacteria bacterium]NIT64982.1 zinc ribbon-containing protein [Gammaproteobacteria bacterium]NIV22001.1 hypothetical protein [Gammaproteobacteria bacterium]NIY33561.1 hypothetical protein [Gammaproteobacteria bacterium]
RVRDTFKKDINSTVQAVRPRLDKATEDAERAFHAWRERGGALWHELGEHSAQVYEVSRDKGGAFVAVLARAFGEWSQNVGSKLDQRLVYHTGEATHGGSFVCMSCEAAIKMRKPGHLPPCPKCHKTEFRRA